MRYLSSKAADAEYADALLKLESRSPWTMTTGRDSSEAYFVSFAINEFLAPVGLRSLSKRQLTFLILQLVEHWEEMSLLRADQDVHDNQGSGDGEDS